MFSDMAMNYLTDLLYLLSTISTLHLKIGNWPNMLFFMFFNIAIYYLTNLLNILSIFSKDLLKIVNTGKKTDYHKNI